MAARGLIGIGALCLLLACAGCTLTPASVEPAAEDGKNAVVFDIDGTLTPNVHAIFKVRKDADTAAHAFFRSDIKIIYLTSRVAALQFLLPRWLHKHGFPDGPIQVTTTQEERENPAAFKRRVLEEYTNKGWTLIAAYGDSSTDFEAYEAAGIPRERVFALRRKGEKACHPGAWQGCYAGWTEQLATIEALVRDTR